MYVNDALGECSRIVKELIVRENLMLVDFFDVMKRLVEQEEYPVFSDHNQKRLELERFIRSIMFVEWATMHEETVEGKLTLEEKKRLSKDRYPEIDWYPHEWKIYNENRDNLNLMRMQLYGLTVKRYDL